MGRILRPDDVLFEAGVGTTATNIEQELARTAIIRAEGAIRRHLRYDPVQAARTEFYPAQDFDYQASGAVWEAGSGSVYLRRLAAASTDELQVRHLPIRRQNSAGAETKPRVWIDYDGRSGTSSNAFADELTEGTDFWANYDMNDSAGALVGQDGIIRSHGRWPTTPNSVKVIYTAGYTNDELRGEDSTIDATPIWTAALGEAVRRMKKALMTAKTSRGWVTGPLTSESLGDYSYSVAGGYVEKAFGGGDIMGDTREMLAEFVNWGWGLGS